MKHSHFLVVRIRARARFGIFAHRTENGAVKQSDALRCAVCVQKQTIDLENANKIDVTREITSVPTDSMSLFHFWILKLAEKKRSARKITCKMCLCKTNSPNINIVRTILPFTESYFRSFVYFSEEKTIAINIMAESGEPTEYKFCVNLARIVHFRRVQKPF